LNKQETSSRRHHPRSQHVGVLGWGRMGSLMGAHLLARGWDVTGYDVSTDALADIERHGGSIAAAPEDVGATSDVILVVVSDDAQVREVVCGTNGVLAGAQPGSTVVVCSGVAPKTCRHVAAAAEDRGVHVIDAAMTGGERGAAKGTLTLLCGGDATAVDACRPVFSAFATNVCLVGPLGSGQMAKALNNCLLLACIQADAEVLRLARALGMEPGTLRPILSVSSGANRPLAEWGAYKLRFPGKDLHNAFALADEAGTDIPFLRSLEPFVTALTTEELDDLR